MILKQNNFNIFVAIWHLKTYDVLTYLLPGRVEVAKKTAVKNSATVCIVL